MSDGCMFCHRSGSPVRVAAEENPLLADDARVCDGCWEVLKDPEAGPRLIRGNLAGYSRQSLDATFRRHVDRFMDRISGWRRGP
jgi:hypothetical protein